MTTVFLVLIWLLASIAEDFLLSKIGLKYLQSCLPIWKKWVAVKPSDVSARGKVKNQWLIPIGIKQLDANDFLLQETFRAGAGVGYPIFCYGHLKNIDPRAILFVRIKWTTFLLPLCFHQSFSDFFVMAALSLITLSGIVLQCVRFTYEAKRKIESAD